MKESSMVRGPGIMRAVNASRKKNNGSKRVNDFIYLLIIDEKLPRLIIKINYTILKKS